MWKITHPINLFHWVTICYNVTCVVLLRYSLIQFRIEIGNAEMENIHLLITAKNILREARGWLGRKINFRKRNISKENGEYNLGFIAQTRGSRFQPQTIAIIGEILSRLGRNLEILNSKKCNAKFRKSSDKTFLKYDLSHTVPCSHSAKSALGGE